MEPLSTGHPMPDPIEHGGRITVVCVDDDPSFLNLIDNRLDEAMDVLTETDPTAALERVERVDCVVSDYDMPEMDGHELLDAVRERDPDVPFLLVTGYSEAGIAEPVLSARRTDYVEKNAVATTADLLTSRVRALVHRCRTEALARRALAAVETVHDGVAIADPDGVFAFADRSFERRFGYAAGDLVGVPWRSVYADEEVERIEGSRLAAVEDGWRWSGVCVARRADDGPFTVTTTVTGLEDGSLVFVVSGDDDRRESSDGV